jgi:hypothetical protein
MKRITRLLALLVALSLLAISASETVFAWQTIIRSFDHNNRYGGEAESGTRAGSVEYTGSERRVRVGASEIAYRQSQIDWMRNWQATYGNLTNAFVFHVNPKNGQGNTCTNIRTVNGWNWTNLPNASLTSKGCGIVNGYNGNEMRFYFNANAVSASLTYYSQSLYKDTGYNGTHASKAEGEMNYDSYATNRFGIGQHKDNHGKICINPDTTYTPTPVC